MAVFVTVVCILAVVGILVFVIGIYNQLVQVRVNVDRSWSNIEVLLKQRYDELPKLVKVCEGYMQYERETLEKITEARTRFLSARTPGQMAGADSQLLGALKTLFAVSEKYPELKANENFRHLQERISFLENQIADRREFFNDSVAIFNSRIQQIPDVFLANMLSYTQKEMFTVPEAQRAAPSMDFNMPHS